jgi:hypothetical protein
VSGGPLLLDAFPGTWEAAHERHVPGRVPMWTGVFSSDNLPGRLNLVASWPDPEVLFVAAGGAPYLVEAALRNGRTVSEPASW